MEYEFTTVRDIYRDRKKYIGSPITVGGWIRSIRSSSKSFGFMVISDGSYFETLQIVFDKDKIDNFDEVSRLNGGSSVIVTGELVETPQAKQPFEIHASKVEVAGESTPDYPMQKTPHDGISAHHAASSSAHQHVPGCVPRTFTGCVCYSSILPGA